MGQPPAPDGFFGRRAALGEGRIYPARSRNRRLASAATFVCRRDGKWWLYLFYATQIGRRDNGRRYEWFREGEYNWFYDQIRYMRQEIK